MKFHVFLTPVHLVEIDCDVHEQVSGVHRFWKDEEVVAEIAQCIGWMQIIVTASSGHKASVTPLTVVGKNSPPANAG